MALVDSIAEIKRYLEALQQVQQNLRNAFFIGDTTALLALAKQGELILDQIDKCMTSVASADQADLLVQEKARERVLFLLRKADEQLAREHGQNQAAQSFGMPFTSNQPQVKDLSRDYIPFSDAGSDASLGQDSRTLGRELGVDREM
ncbi:hypothetical protein AUJ68_01070 [Candidatus Woesearchaeota archaeon CG1_02_57_44]|nr:MAG: hypothetical protein AUJ68_01070 [Candidatus Woesearchaeota archaeon CG1_02_57_44]PIN68285.1 MAG: hypothetical protein COV94_05520 [Candidatus Woesearchaeota archaeon CG11_big_fil_rev_8_21_14_0_20_57_5]